MALEGVRFVITARDDFDSARLGLEIAAALQKLYPGKIDFDANKKLVGSTEVIRALAAGDDPRDIQQKMADSVVAFLKLREKYLLYRSIFSSKNEPGEPVSDMQVSFL